MIQAITLQGAAPTGNLTVINCESVGVDQERAAGLVFWSTVLSLITASLWGTALSLLMPSGG
jgi:predicted permease